MAQENKKWLKFGIPVLVLLVAAVGLIGYTRGWYGAEKLQSQPVMFKVGYAPNSASASLSFLAQEQGYFKEEGLEVELIPFSSSADGLNALNAGKIDLGVAFGTAAPLTFISQGAGFEIIGGQLSGGHPIIAKPENANQFNDIMGFKGKQVATTRLFTGDVIWRGALVRAGLDPAKDVEIIEMKKASDVLEAVKAGKADVGIGAPSIYYKAKESGLQVVGWSNDLWPDHPCCRVVARSSQINDNPEAYKGFLRALIRAEKLREENVDLSVAANQKILQLDGAQAEALTTESHQTMIADPNRKAVRQMWQEMIQFGYINSSLNIDEHINVDLYQQALESLARQYPDDPFYQGLQARFIAHN